jgi:hypothetical protein
MNNHYSNYPDDFQSAWVSAEDSAAELAKQAAELIAAGKLAPDYASHCLTLAEVRRAVKQAAQAQDASPDMLADGLHEAGFDGFGPM